MDYESFRHFADSWGLIFLTLIFVAAVAWSLRPGGGERYREVANLPLRDDREADHEQ